MSKDTIGLLIYLATVAALFATYPIATWWHYWVAGGAIVLAHFSGQLRK
jgi:hypothetical protein